MAHERSNFLPTQSQQSSPPPNQPIPTENDNNASNHGPPPGAQDEGTNHAAQQFSCLYFGFASNLSPRTLRQRCPSALFAGVGALKGWRFVISEVGFGNIVPSTTTTTSADSDDVDVVYGSLHFLSPRDEAALDKSEEVPQWHRKMKLKVTRLADPKDLSSGAEVEVTTYVDVERVGEGVISKEYIVWIRKVIADGLHLGVPPAYFERYMNRFLPEDGTVGKEDNVLMIRTVEMDKTDTGYVPSHVLKLATKDKAV